MKASAVKLRFHTKSAPLRQTVIEMAESFLDSEFKRLGIPTEEGRKLPRRFIGFIHNHPEELHRFA